VIFAAGLAMLVGGAELLVRGASRLAVLLRVSSLIVGLTIVAFGTSFPELAVSVQSALSGKADIALGNVVGSNIFNVLFILGISAIISPLAVSLQLVRFDVPIMIGASALTFIMALDGAIGRIDGLILFSLIVVYTVWLFFKESAAVGDHDSNERIEPSGKGVLTSVLHQSALIIVGLIMLVVGSRWLVTGAVAFARILGVSELLIGLTVVAAGTSLPEAATSIVAAIRHERDIAVGNIVGSNIFNIFSVLGLSSALAAGGIAVNETALHFDIPVMIAVAFACLPVFFTGSRIARWEGFLFFGYYVAYTVYLVLSAKHGIMLGRFNYVMAVFVIPITVITLIVSVVGSVRAGRCSQEKLL